MAPFEHRPAFRFNTPSSMMIVGPSGCGKTVFTTKLLVDNPDLFETPPKKNLLLLRILARRLQTHETTRYQVSRRDSRFGTLTRLVTQRRVVGVGRSDGRRRQRQTRLGSLHQTFSSSKRYSSLLVSRHVSTREICQEHFQERALHCGFQEPPRSIGDAESVTASVSRAMARGARHLSKSHRTPFWLHAIGSPPQEQ